MPPWEALLHRIQSLPRVYAARCATDAPASGELWRLEYGSGESSGNAMWIGIDNSQQVWIRAGTDLVKPLRNNDYRLSRGPTVIR